MTGEEIAAKAIERDLREPESFGEGNIRIDNALREVVEELREACKTYRKIHGPHEGYAVILEELDELKAEVWQRHYDQVKLRKEASHVAAMAIRFMIDVAYATPEFAGRAVYCERGRVCALPSAPPLAARPAGK